MFPALNITDIARINLAGRTRSEIEAEALDILHVIRRTRLQYSGARPMQATVCNMHRVMLTITFHHNAPPGPADDEYWALSWTSDGLMMLEPTR